MTNNDEIVFDTNSGISVEEQKEILSRINGIAEKNRRSLQGGTSGGKSTFKAKKTGILFPALVNVAALVILAGGGLLLISFNGKKDAQVREGTGVYNLTERALIEEIRKDTANKLASKEKEIASISSRLEEVDAQLQQLHSGNQDLTADQMAVETRLRALQNAYRMELAALQEERSKILEDSRAREMVLRAQLEERTREFAAAQQKSTIELSSAMSELEHLTGEQEKAAAIDAQLSGGLAAVNDMIQKEQFDQASQAVKDLRSFLNTGSFQSIRSFQTRREFYARSLDSMETMIEDVRRNRGSVVTPALPDAGNNKELAEIQSKNAQLEETIAEMKKTIAALDSGSSGQARRLTELENSVSSLRSEKAALETNTAEKDRTIRSLESEKTGLTQTIAARDSTIRELQSSNSSQTQQINSLNDQITNIRQALQTLSQ